MTLNLIITEADLTNLKKLEDQERINPLTSERLFKGIIYTMLSTQELYTRQMKMYNKMIAKHLDNPKAILERPDEVSQIARGLKKSEYIMELAEWWPTSNIYEDIITDIHSNRTKEFSIRNKIAENASGLSYKGASLVMNMCGYTDVVALDVWALRVLVAEDYPVKPYYYIPKSGKKNFKHTYLGKGVYFDRGISNIKEYRPYEEFFWELTAKHNQRYDYNFTPFDFRRLVWLKRSAWGKEFGNDINQLVLSFDC